MERPVDFQTLWRQFSEPRAEDSATPCPLALEFSTKLADVIFAPLGKDPSRGQIAQAKYLLQEEWHAWRKALPPSHARRTRLQRGHSCLDEAYHTAYDRLQLLELTLRPPDLIADYDELLEHAKTRDTEPVALTPPPPPPEQVFGVGIGQLTDEHGQR